jgi:endonuclease YncB( thermonuclease family)
MLPVVMALLACAWNGAAADEPLAAERCQLESQASYTVARVADAETIVLDDGSEVRLIGALAPRSPDQGAADWPPERAAREALERLLLGRNVELKLAGRQSDRYGRRMAHVFVMSDSEKTWVQGYLLSQGLARAYALDGNSACLSAMLAVERDAREGARGIWGMAAYRVLEATEVRELLRRRNRFEVVEGIVRDVAVTGGRAYLNFGPDWRRDFTAVVPPRLLTGSPETAVRLKALLGKRARVRGWIERRNGPSVEIAAIGEIEVLEPRDPAKEERPVAGDTGAPR